MTIRQWLLKAFYPLLMLKSRMARSSRPIVAKNPPQPTVSFYSLVSTVNDGHTFDFKALRGKKVLLVNTASDCGFTAQYTALQSLQNKYPHEIVVLAFPSNDFKQQEKGSDAEIAAFCKSRYGVTFPLMKKSVVKKQAGQNPVFSWLTNASLNGWNDREPGWNFTKYLVDERGVLTHYIPHDISPMDKSVLSTINFQQQ